jgi:acetyl-CoA carboxylase/biotin carboxylase 1
MQQVVENDKEGISSILDWLSFVPKDKYSPPPVMDVAVDSPERDVDFQPTKTPYDPRHMLAGTNAPDGRWVSGFFDRGSFIETLAGWGKSVVTGRAKLGEEEEQQQ